MHPGGFEPPTARFVAEYSIQLSYGCIGKLALLPILIRRLTLYPVRDGASGRMTRLHLALRAVAWATLSSLVLAVKPQPLKQQRDYCLGEDGASGRIRTSDRSVRSRVLYPAELRMQMAVRRGFEPRMQLLTAYSLSRGAPSASRPPHHTPLTSASKNMFLLIVAAWRTYYFLGLISQTIFPALLSFAHFTLN